MPKKPKTATHPPKKPKPLYRQKPRDVAAVCDRRHSAPSPNDLPAAKPIPPSHFELREDGTIQAQTTDHTDHAKSESSSASSASSAGNTPRLIFSSDSPFVRLYQGNCLELLDAIHAKYGDAGRFDCIFADPPYFLSNGGITYQADEMVESVEIKKFSKKGDKYK